MRIAVIDDNKSPASGIARLLTRPVGRPPSHVRRFHASFSYQAGSWNKKRRVVAKVEWHTGESYPRIGLDRFHRSSVTNLSRPAERVMAFYNQRGKAEQYVTFQLAEEIDGQKKATGEV